MLPQGITRQAGQSENDRRRTIVRKHAGVLAVFVVWLAVLPLVAQAPSQTDLSAIHQIKDEGFNDSKVMEIMSYLTDVYGPRLTNSPNIKEAASWTTGKMREWQLANVHLEPWGPFGRGWSNERFSAQVISPRPFPLIAYPKAWTPGTNGHVTAEAVFAPILKEEDIAKYRGQLKGKFVLTAAIPENPERFEPQAHRYTDAELADLATQPVPVANAEDRAAQFRVQREFNLKVQKFLFEEGVAAWIEPSRSDDGTVFVQQGGGRDKEKDPPAPPRVAVASENYGRIVRIGLWTGEEQGLLGSRAYVKQHFADPEVMKPTPEHTKLDAYYNVDNGTGKIRGVYLQGNEMVAPIFSAWMLPFHDLGMNTLTIRNTGGTDHLAFNAVGLPGFQFIQDPLDYDTRTHHSNMDVYERIQEPDMKQMAVIVASFVYLTANRDEMLPRKPLPKPQPARPPM